LSRILTAHTDDMRHSAVPFAALGDQKRLWLVSRLCHGGPASITRLAAGAPITRQAVTKHLRVMEEAGLARSSRRGRERLWQLSNAGWKKPVAT